MIYLDNAASTAPLDEVVDKVAYVMKHVYANPSSLHKKGIEAENIIKFASDYFASKLGCSRDDIIYTSGGTESNNLAILGVANAYHRYGNKIITTSIEHSSVKEVMTFLSKDNGLNEFEICILPTDEFGHINLEQLRAEINDNTILVSIMHVNNEIGAIQNINQIGQLIKTANPNTIFHVDAVQSFTKLPISIKSAKIDLLSVSAHKFYGPKGVGFLYKNNKVRLANILHGGGQQKNLRSGTENTAGIAGMHEAAVWCFSQFDDIREHYLMCKQHLADGILTTIPNTKINGPSIGEGAPHILNIDFDGIKSEVLLHALESHDIFVSAGSACSSKKQSIRPNAIRFSFSKYTSLADLDYTVKILDQQVNILRRYSAR
ncbi:MAG: cysteine desulfurase [Epulopiscium sp. Nele67-Bin001]|nr:MAG: cysteine desulfurase [Epulopiscium sp. Nele67-Bin001]